MSYGSVTVYYGDSTGHGPQADALAFVYYDGNPPQNGVNFAIAYFHRDGDNYRFIKTFPDITGDLMQSTPDAIVKGTTVQFLPGKARFSMVIHRDTDALCCPTGRANHTVTLNPASPASGVRHYENVDASGDAGGALAASPEVDYLEARDRAIAEVKALENSKASQSTIDAAMDKALADLTKRLKDIVGPVSGFPGPGGLNLDTLSENQVGYGNLDGVAYGDKGLDVVVTTRSLLTAWLEGKAKEEDKESRLPTDVEAAVRQENFYSGGDAAFAKYADLPATKPAGAALAVAALGLFRQDNTASPPDTIVATIVKGDRVFVASIPRTAPIGKIPACEAIWTEASRKADQLQAEYVASGLKNKKLAEEGIQAQHQGDRDDHACFNARAPKQSFFAGLTKEAQSLVDRLALSSKDYTKDYPERLAEFQKDQAVRRKEAQEVDFSEVKMDDAEKSYPFLHEEVQGLRTDQKENTENIKANSDKTFPDPSVSIEIAESRGKINLLFVMSNGMLYCGTGGCGTDVYADEGAGYKKAFDALTFGPVYVTRTGGQVFLYLANPNVISSHFSSVDNALPTEFILKDHQFVENKPPPREPDSPPPAGFAATVTTTSPSTFAADTTGVVNGNFSDVPTLIPGGPNGGTYSVYNPLSGYASPQGVSFSTTNLDGNVNVISAYFYGPNDPPKPYAVNSVYSGTAPDILTITLPMAATAFYLDFTTLFVSTMATFDLSNGFSTTISPTVAYPRTPEFLGFLSNAPFTTITLTVPSQRSWVVADFGYGIATATSPAPRVRHYENVDASGNDRGSWIRGVSSAACESICIADSGCAGYTYNRSRATCIPKSIVVRLMGSSEPAVTGVVEGR